MFSLVTLLSACETSVLVGARTLPSPEVANTVVVLGHTGSHTWGVQENQFEIGRLSFHTLRRIFKMELVLKGFPASLLHSVRKTATPLYVAFPYILYIKDLLLSQCGGECTVCTVYVGLYPVLFDMWASG